MTGKYDDVDDLPESIEQALARTDQDDGIILISEELPVLTLRNTVLSRLYRPAWYRSTEDRALG